MSDGTGDLERLRGMSAGNDRVLLSSSGDGRGKPRLTLGTAMIWCGIGVALLFGILRFSGLLKEPYIFELTLCLGLILCGVGANINRERRSRRA